jgi:hypothetical protein
MNLPGTLFVRYKNERRLPSKLFRKPTLTKIRFHKVGLAGKNTKLATHEKLKRQRKKTET